MEYWECKFCDSLTSVDQDVCWSCNRTKAASAAKPPPVAKIPPKVSVSDAISSNKQFGIVMGIIGVLLFLFGLVRFNSMASQIMRAVGGRDDLGLFLLTIGGLLAIGGFAIFNNSSGSQPATPTMTDGGLSNAEVNQSSGSSATTDAISKLERLMALKERGALTEKEFDEQKAKLLS